jgi:hypothetical protein
MPSTFVTCFRPKTPCLEIPKLQGGIIRPAQCQFPIPRDLQASPKRPKFSPKQNPEPTAFWSSMRQHHPASKHIPDPQRLSFANQIRVSIEYGRPRCGTGVPKLQRTFAIAEASESGLPGAHRTGHLTHTWYDYRMIIVYNHILCIKLHVHALYV